MNPFYERHEDRHPLFHLCFDRILLDGLIQPVRRPERVVGFFEVDRRLRPVSRDTLRGPLRSHTISAAESR